MSYGWKLGHAVQRGDADIHSLAIHFTERLSRGGPEKVSVDWEILLGEEVLRSYFGDQVNPYGHKRFASKEDFEELSGTVAFEDYNTNSAYIRIPAQHDLYEKSEVFGVKLSNPSAGTEIQDNSGLGRREIPQNFTEDLIFSVSPLNSFEEGEELKFRVDSNASESYFDEELSKARFKFTGLTARPSGDDGYAGKQDLAPEPILFLGNGKYHHGSEPLEISIRNGSVFSLNGIRAAEDNLVEGDENLDMWIDLPEKPDATQYLTLAIKDNLAKKPPEEVNGLSDSRLVQMPGRFKRRLVDKITNFNPSADTLEIDSGSFGIDSSATFALGKNKKTVKKRLAKQDFDFLYDQKKGGLYFNENGADKGFGDGGIIAILKGAPDLTSGNLEFI